MRNFKSDNRFSSDRGGRDSRGGSSMHQATCADCGKKCEVPFKPTGDRPVYCSDCFGKQNGNSGRSDRKSFGRPSFGGDRPSFGDRPKFDATCAKCGKHCEVPFRPTGGKPVYCNDCFDKGSSSSRDHGTSSGGDMAAINAKLDRILKILAPVAAEMGLTEKIEKKAPVEKEKKAVKEEKAEVVKEETVKPKKEKKSAVKAKIAEKKVSKSKKK